MKLHVWFIVAVIARKIFKQVFIAHLPGSVLGTAVYFISLDLHQILLRDKFKFYFKIFKKYLGALGLLRWSNLCNTM